MSEPGYPDALPAQHRLHWYVIERVLGQGGFGITYLARDTNLDQPVAIKEYLPVDVATRRPDATIRWRTEDNRERYRWGLDRFIKEARTLARFDHPNIVRVLSVFELNDTAYMVMRFEAGDNLSAVLDSRGTLTEDDLLRVMLPVLDGLALVHGAGFIHRDIKPDNIHIRTDGSPVLLDFGSARNAVGKAHTLTILVAPGYAPFEQYYSSSESQGPWTDIYSLGATCYRAIAGRAPLDAITRSKGILGSTRDVLVPAAVVGAGRYSGRLLAAIDHALAFAEKDRPQTVADWKRELVGDGAAKTTTAVQTERLPPRGPAPPPAVAPAPPPATAITHPGGEAPWWSGARGPIIWSIAGASLAAVAIGVFLHQYGGTRAAPAPGPAATEPKPDPSAEVIRDKVAALEKQLAEERARQEAERKEREAERAREEERRKQAAEAKAKTAVAQPAAKAAPKPEPTPRPAPPPPNVAPAVKPEPAPTPVALAPSSAPAEPPPPTPAQQLAAAEQAIARGNYADAAALVSPLAEKGNARAQRVLGDLLASGRGVARDDAEARAWYERAGKQFDADAQAKLGEMYAGGLGVSRDANLAYVWFAAAARNGNAAARGQQERLAATLQPAELDQLNRVAETLVAPARRR
jgi:hypothetical protein